MKRDNHVIDIQTVTRNNVAFQTRYKYSSAWSFFDSNSLVVLWFPTIITLGDVHRFNRHWGAKNLRQNYLGICLVSHQLNLSTLVDGVPKHEWLAQNFRDEFSLLFPRLCTHPCDISVGHVLKLSPFRWHADGKWRSKREHTNWHVLRLPAMSFLSSNARHTKWRAPCKTRLPKSKRTRIITPAISGIRGGLARYFRWW